MSTPRLHMQTAITQAQTFVTLLPLIRDAHPNISFWGQRYVHIIGHQGTWPIDTLVEHVLTMIKNHPLNEDELRAGQEIAGLIDRTYVISFDQTTHLNFITYFCCRLRDWWANNIALTHGCLGTRHYWNFEDVLHNDE